MVMKEGQKYIHVNGDYQMCTVASEQIGIKRNSIDKKELTL